MTLTQSQCFFVLLLVAAARGYSRGGGREIISALITLAGVIFLMIGGGSALERFFFVTVPDVFRGIPAPPIVVDGTPPNPLMDLGLVVGVVTLAQLVGHYFGQPAKTMQHHMTGLLVGALSGMVLLYYITRTLFPSTTIELTSPSTPVVTTYMVAILSFGLMLLLILTLVKR